MNIVALSNRLASKVPHWHELEKLSKEDKIEVIALLSMSMANAEEIKTPADRTKEMVERCCGSWGGEQSAEDIIANPPHTVFTFPQAVPSRTTWRGL